MAPYRVGILGMGRIAAGYDNPGSGMVRTHVAGILAEPRLTVAAVADLDRAHAAAELKRFGLAARIVTPEELLASDVDVVCIATPDGTHIGFAEQAVAGRARIVLSEKPIEGDADRRRGLAAALAARGAALCIHHVRRWIPGLGHWIDDARHGAYGRPLSAVGRYNRGLRHNGIHAFDLIGAFVGTAVTDVRAFGPSLADFDERDPTRSMLVMLKCGDAEIPLTVLGVDGRIQSMFEVDILFERARIVIADRDGPCAERHEAADSGYAGFAPELRLAERYHDKEQRLLAEVWRNIADCLDGGAALACSGAEMFAGYDLLDAINARLPQ